MGISSRSMPAPGARRQWWQPLFHMPPDDFPNRLWESPTPTLTARWGLVGLLCVVCFVPRAWVACRWDLLWTDTITFYHASQSLATGDLQRAFAETGLNLYPVILWGLGGLGLDWAVAGKWWSTLLATLVVLPLWGWVRRQFDDQMALLAVLLYAIHGKLIALSPLVIRDPTFWFFFMLTIYLLWRGIVEIRGRFMLAGGVGLMLSAYLRTEGWLLVVPLVLWTAIRWRTAGKNRWWLAAAAAGALAITPLMVVLLNVTWLRSAPQWLPVRSDHIEILRHRFQNADPIEADTQARTTASTSSAPSEPSRSPPSVPVAGTLPSNVSDDLDPASAPPPGLSKLTIARKLGLQLVKAYTYSHGVWALVGVAGWWWVYWRRDHQVLALMAALLLAAIWVRSLENRSDVRYFMPMVLVSFPWMAGGLLAVPKYLVRWTSSWLVWPPSRHGVLAAVLAAGVVVPSLFEIKLPWGRFMENHAALGRWIRSTYGPQRTIATNIREVRLIQYYSQAVLVGEITPNEWSSLGIPQVVAAARPQIVILWHHADRHDPWDDCAQRILAADLGYQQAPDTALPVVCHNVIVLLHKDILSPPSER